MNQHLTEQIDALLPQTQCRKCGFSGCKPYAEAIAAGRADINQCPPGGQEGIQQLARLLGIPPKPLNIAHGVPNTGRMAALIDETMCIGCTFCVQACPVDAIVGAAKQLHTVIAAECTGCELCIAPCPMDCIRLVSADAVPMPAPQDARLRHRSRSQRLDQAERLKKEQPENTVSALVHDLPSTTATERKKAIVQAALDRALALRAQTDNNQPSMQP
ncbi:RnfABCDGE type electron transport complex subunit B [Nitrosomonas sp. JL21]|uniref:RnfABCDGE type electron transport complex subunit B n=1 Tax=Nitrosomonas sp. JL21 TaxID=153949 RepID=UPI00136EA905|nr:RnfABCDGE type electron transport complex subunit B [Nitrosomonas sp. JL21]MBL8496757.1 RnfABCDGE type electron transport complex subunit B [Nitrosomonas sp.]MCC7090857.1 RnfABCDGE type electron transport complex subunit B [Nitrosomonas sp.]MXS76504.1 RnfABCDGE type electron transport complex subunit B [Nitrosomonas sp. JL21]